MNHKYYSCHYPRRLIIYGYPQTTMQKNYEDLLFVTQL